MGNLKSTILKKIIIINASIKLCMMALTIVTFQSTSAQTNTKAWEEDINFLQSELEIRHANLYHSISKDSLTYYFDLLKSKLVTLDGTAIHFELAKILTKIGDGHTGYALHTNEYKDSLYLPLNLIKLNDGFAVINSADEYKNLIGQKLVKIGGIEIETLAEMTLPYILHDNVYGQARLLENFLTIGSLLKHLGVIIKEDTIQASFKNSDGKITETRIHMVSSEGRKSFSLPAQKFKEIKWLQTTDKKFYTQIFDDSILYIQLNSSDIGREDEENIESLVNEIIKKTAEKSISKIVLDLRLNRGGSFQRTKPLLKALISIDQLYPEKQLFVLISNTTFSAGVSFAERLNMYTNAVFVGTPTGGKPNGFGDLGILTLPNSNIRLRYSRLNLILDDWDSRPAIFPDLRAPINYEDLIMKNDPTMHLVKTYKNKKQISENLQSLLTKDSLSGFIIAYKELKLNHYNDYIFDPNTLNRIAVDFYRKKDMDSALKLLELNVKEYPWSPLAHSNFGEINLELGNKEIAMKHLETAFKIHKGYTKWRDELNDINSKFN